MFAKADLVITTTNFVADDLRAHLNHMRASGPRIVTVPLPAQFADHKRIVSAKEPRSPGAPLRLLSVSTWEPRKNITRLLGAIRDAATRSTSPIELMLIGQRGYFADYDAEVEGIIANMPQVTARSDVSDEQLTALYAWSDASVYCSIEEGFGLPIGESLWLATPCVCHNGSAMAEVAPGGGALMIDMTDEAAIASALLDLIEEPEVLARLSSEAIGRQLASWNEYASRLASKIVLDVC
jgi:glycosyltransferase involved in cell wall biosynthesis